MKDQMREEFEAWVISNWPAQSLSRFSAASGGEYQGFTVQHCWEAWKASRESMVVELPAIRAEDYDPLGNVTYREECRLAIESAGVKVSP